MTRQLHITDMGQHRAAKAAANRDNCPPEWVQPLFDAAVEAARHGLNVDAAVADARRSLERGAP